MDRSKTGVAKAALMGVNSAGAKQPMAPPQASEIQTRSQSGAGRPCDDPRSGCADFSLAAAGCAGLGLTGRNCQVR